MNWDWDKLQEKRQRQGSTPPPPPDNNDPEKPLKDFTPGKFFSQLFKGRLKAGPVAVLALLVWLATGVFIVNPGEVGLVMQFGAFSREVKEGPHYRLPWPIESTIIINTELVRTIEIGISADKAKRTSQVSAEESSMFTGDENIVHMQFNVLYNIINARDYLFNGSEPVNMITGAAEAAMREVVGRSNIDAILTSGRSTIQADAHEVLAEILKTYDIGVSIHSVQLLDVQPPSEVEEAFKDVASAREDRVRIINQAEAYRNEIVPVANGTAAGLLNEAAAYAKTVEATAQGESGRFLAMVGEFNQAKDITRKRLYLEAMSDILSSPGMEKIILSGDQQGGNVLPFLNLDRTAAPKRPAPAPTGKE